MIAQKTPEDLNRIFYTICGSTAVETAIKISVAYFRSIGQTNRFKFVGRERGYHGMNIGALTVGGAFTSLGIDDNCSAERLQLADSTIEIMASGVKLSGFASGTSTLDKFVIDGGTF